MLIIGNESIYRIPGNEIKNNDMHSFTSMNF